MMPEEMLERKAADPKIIRNYNKVKTIKANAQMLFEHKTEHNTSFAQFIADWPSNDIIGLWEYLKKQGQRLGGNTGPYALRLLGKDVAFVCGSDEHGVPITIKAKKEGVTPQDIVDKYHAIIKKSFEDFGVSFDNYSRTSAKIHHDTAHIPSTSIRLG
mgnify:CR=1 FL=1